VFWLKIFLVALPVQSDVFTFSWRRTQHILRHVGKTRKIKQFHNPRPQSEHSPLWKCVSVLTLMCFCGKNHCSRRSRFRAHATRQQDNALLLYVWASWLRSAYIRHAAGLRMPRGNASFITLPRSKFWRFLVPRDFPLVLQENPGH
jgi:hypothetical protein